MAIEIGPGITVEQGIKFGTFPAVPSLVMNLDAATYSGSGPWVDSVASKSFTLYNSPTWSDSIGGGSFLFNPASSQYASTDPGLGSLGNWSVEVWHYYTGNNTGGAGSPCIITEWWPNPASQINFSLGTLSDSATPYLQAGMFKSAWQSTAADYTLTANNWYQIVGTYDGMNVKLYVNGTMVRSTPVAISIAAGNQGIYLMKRWDTSGPGFSQYWGGRLASVKIWNGDINFENVRGSYLKNKSRYGL